MRGRGWDREPRPRAFYRYPWRAPPTSSAGAAAGAAHPRGSPPTSSTRRAAPLAAVCEPDTPLREVFIKGDHTTPRAVHLPWAPRRPTGAPSYIPTLPVGHISVSYQGTHSYVQLLSFTSRFKALIEMRKREKREKVMTQRETTDRVGIYVNHVLRCGGSVVVHLGQGYDNLSACLLWRSAGKVRPGCGSSSFASPTPSGSRCTLDP